MERHRHREAFVTLEAEFEVMLPEAKCHQGLLESTRN